MGTKNTSKEQYKLRTVQVKSSVSKRKCKLRTVQAKNSANKEQYKCSEIKINKKVCFKMGCFFSFSCLVQHSTCSSRKICTFFPGPPSSRHRG